jgi:glycosyltransferase involved in cell wall biosynthesis
MNKVCVVLPIHGDAPFLKETLSSIKNQSFREFKCILVLDRVTSAISKLTTNYCVDNPEFVIIESKGAGISNALNTGLMIADSEYIARIDADDLMDEDRLENQVKFLEENPSKILIGTQIRFINENGDYLRESNYETKPEKLSQLLKIRNQIAHPSTMYRRENVIKNGGYDSTFDGCEDYHLWLRLNCGESLTNLKKTLTSYRQHQLQVTNKNRRESFYLESLSRIDSEYTLDPILKISIKDNSRNSEMLSAIRRKTLMKIFLRNPNSFRRFTSRDYLNRALSKDLKSNKFYDSLSRILHLTVALILSPNQSMLFMKTIFKEFSRRSNG